MQPTKLFAEREWRNGASVMNCCRQALVTPRPQYSCLRARTSDPGHSLPARQSLQSTIASLLEANSAAHCMREGRHIPLVQVFLAGAHVTVQDVNSFTVHAKLNHVLRIFRKSTYKAFFLSTTILLSL